MVMITPAQLRAARGLLDWTRSELAKASGLSAETIKNIEHGIYAPQDTTIQALINAFANNNVEFTEGEGVRRSLETVVIFDGATGFKRFMDDVYEAAVKESKKQGDQAPICVSNVDDRLFVQHLGHYAQVHVDRMNKLNNVKIKVLTGEKDYYKAPKTDYIEYRWSGVEETMTVPFYVYGDKFAVLIFKEGKEPRVVVISSRLVAKAYREQFDVLWELSKKYNTK